MRQTKEDRDFVEKIRTIGTSVKPPLKPRHNATYRREDMRSLCLDSKSPVTQMLDDKVMFKNIRDGNASDKGLKRDALYLQQNYANNRKKERQDFSKAKITAKKEKYRKRYKCDPL